MVTANSGWHQEQAKHSVRRVYLSCLKPSLHMELPAHYSVFFNQRQVSTCPDVKSSTNPLMRTENCSKVFLNNLKKKNLM